MFFGNVRMYSIFSSIDIKHIFFQCYLSYGIKLAADLIGVGAQSLSCTKSTCSYSVENERQLYFFSVLE